MKKILVLATIGMLGLVSCKKDYTCTCTETYTSGSDVDVDTWNYQVKEASKKQAEIACNEATIKYEAGNETSETKCELTK